MKNKRRADEVNFYLFLLDLLKQGKSPAQISKEFNISKQRIYYYTTRLKKQGIIKKKQNGVWEIVKDHIKDARQKRIKQIRGHALIWKIKTPKELGKKWINLLEKNNIDYKIQSNNTIRIFLNKRKIWLAKESIIVYEPHSFYGKDAFESRKYAVISLIETLQQLSNKIHINLTRYPFKASREHYGMVKNELAQQLNRNNEKLIIRDDLDGEWLWVDDSTGMMGELETGGKGITQDRAGLNKRVQNYYNDHKKHNFQVTASYTLNAINQVTQNQQMFAQNLESHIEAIQTLSQTIKELREEIRNIKNGKHN